MVRENPVDSTFRIYLSRRTTVAIAGMLGEKRAEVKDVKIQDLPRQFRASSGFIFGEKGALSMPAEVDRRQGVRYYYCRRLAMGKRVFADSALPARLDRAAGFVSGNHDVNRDVERNVERDVNLDFNLNGNQKRFVGFLQKGDVEGFVDSDVEVEDKVEQKVEQKRDVNGKHEAEMKGEQKPELKDDGKGKGNDGGSGGGIW